jgi:hypothetical protein
MVVKSGSWSLAGSDECGEAGETAKSPITLAPASVMVT